MRKPPSKVGAAFGAHVHVNMLDQKRMKMMSAMKALPLPTTTSQMTADGSNQKRM